MYDKLNITENHLNILELFTQGFDKEYYIREVQKLLKISPRTAQLILEDLEKKAVLESTTKGKIKLYKIKQTAEAREYITFTEIYKRINFMEKSLEIREIIDRLAPKINGIGFIFGSYVKGIEKKDSDLDIFIAGTYDKKEFERLSNLYDLKLDIKNYPLSLFKRKINEDILIREVLDNHVMLCGSEELINMIIKPKF
ncbi:MAG: nucleotidyltransferase domain-containing protein [archaeon]